MKAFKVINTKQKIIGAFKFKPIVYTMCATSNDGKRECYSEREQGMDWEREHNADVVNAILLSNKLARVYICLLKQHACN